MKIMQEENGSRTATERQQHILELVNSQGFASIEHLAKLFSVSPQTIRRDINKLNKRGLLQRYHGGAGKSSSVENLAYPARKVLCLEEKRKIARLVSAQIPDHASLFINIGTTTEEVAKQLISHKGLRVITNNLNVAMIMSENEDFEVFVTGGRVRSYDRGITGEATKDFISQFKVDYGIIGISGVDSDGSLLDFDYREVRAAREIIANSRKVFMVADHTKFGRKAMVRLGKLSEVDALFTDTAPPSEHRELFTSLDTELQVADFEQDAGSDMPSGIS